MIVALIVLYHPSVPLLTRLLRGVSRQVDFIVAVDNSPHDLEDQHGLFESYGSKVSYTSLGVNVGIAAAQNIGIRKAKAVGATHILFLDQDSAVSEGMVSVLIQSELRLVNSGIKVAAVGPVFVDEKQRKRLPAIRHRFLFVQRIDIAEDQREPVPVDYLISSGSLIRTSVLEEVGPMMQELFIDWVDIEWGLRARSKRYQSFMIPTALMLHSIGDAAVTLFGRGVNLHNDVRNYYIVRNATFLLRSPAMGWSWRIVTTLKIPLYLIFYSWCSQDKLKSFRLLLRAFSDGIRGAVGQLR
jgi:rhamnosyltransferase